MERKTIKDTLFYFKKMFNNHYEISGLQIKLKWQLVKIIRLRKLAG